MGTNFYWLSNKCDKCGHAEPRRHIGKSSFGWCFALRVYPSEEIACLDDWRVILESGGGVIVNEYGQTVTPDEMLRAITDRNISTAPTSKAWFAQNHAVLGPNNLARHAIGGLCVSHGPGTWDCLVGEFS